MIKSDRAIFNDLIENYNPLIRGEFQENNLGGSSDHKEDLKQMVMEAIMPFSSDKK